MRAQFKDYWCGLASMANALEVIGVKTTQKALNRICYVPRAGTSEEELKRGLLAHNAQLDEVSFRGRDSALSWLHEHIHTRGPAILCVDAWEHWTTCIGTVGGKFVLFDPARGVGIRFYEEKALASRWLLGKCAGGPAYYGIGVSK